MGKSGNMFITHDKKEKKKSGLTHEQVKAVDREIVKKMRAENEAKYIVYDQTSYSAVNTSFAQTGSPLLSPLATNITANIGGYNPVTDCYTMEGMEIYATGLELSYALQVPQTAPDGSSSLTRMMVLWDNEPATDTSFTSSLELYSAGNNYDDVILRDNLITAQPYGHSQLNKGLRDSDRYTILYDKTHPQSIQDHTSFIKIDKWISLHGKKLRFSQSTASGLYPLTANLLFFAIADTNGAVPKLVFSSRFWFKEVN